MGGGGALQGAFIEHQTILEQLVLDTRRIEVVLVRTTDDLERCDALIIPGGESTTIALLAKLSNLLTPLRNFVATKPVWGTCAGAILLSRSVEGAKKGGQELFGGMSVRIARNGFGSQVESFETELAVDGLREGKGRLRVVLELTPTPTDPPIEIIARLSPELAPHSPPSSHSQNGVRKDEPETYVALRQGLHLLTTFHPELTNDSRFHEYFVRDFFRPPPPVAD
ncbi:class I glutamine amidotransferase-like protein [Cyathus striatus]|nr:class I glutamine amidotransferase-like protein [Cyathus striatus]